MEKKQYVAPVSEFVDFRMGDIVATYGGELEPGPAPDHSTSVAEVGNLHIGVIAKPI